MNRLVMPGKLSGVIAAPPSKSAAHRALICAALTKKENLPAKGLTVGPVSGSVDMDATLGVLNAMGGKLCRTGNLVTAGGFAPAHGLCRLNCRESGSTFRFLLPVAAALGLNALFLGEGRLPERPIGPLAAQLAAHGIVFSGERMPFSISGRLSPGEFSIPGDISSQYVSGLLFALPLLEGDSRLRLTTPLQSAAYVKLTLDALHGAGIHIVRQGDDFLIPGNQAYKALSGPVEGDWSNAAFWLCAGALAGRVTLTGLRRDSAQGDKAIVPILRTFGASVLEEENADGCRVTVEAGQLKGCRVDVGEIPDLAPVLAVTAAFAQGESELYNAARLRLKESDRIACVAALLRDLGGGAEEFPDRLVIHGGGLSGGKAQGAGDHRIVMSAAVAALRCKAPVEITGASAVTKSYPDFFDDYERLGGKSHDL